MTSNQENFFLLKEADDYFKRNPIKPNKFILNAVKLLQPDPKDDIIEIGCSTGVTLSKIKSVYGSKVYGLDPSKKAINYGKKKYNLDYIYSDIFLNFKLKKKFDITINGGFFYVTPNNIIKKTIKKISKMMKINSYFIFWDYDTPYNYTNDWKYHKSIKSYKRNYINLINKIDNNLYLISKKQFNINTGKEIRHYHKKINIDNITTVMIFKKIK
ncbi:class I SAM-dependent methyltransferase [Candidatus Pelagibacter ubique]|nr:class I SAM-dependent methyltransferase [Candidatus Pelagibacter ubique]